MEQAPVEHAAPRESAVRDEAAEPRPGDRDGRHPADDDALADRLVRWAPLAILAVALAWITTKAAAPIDDPDDWWHLRLGNDLLDQHALSAPDHWSRFADQAWVPTEPLPEIVCALVNRWLGLPGLAWLFGVFLLLVTLSVYVLNRQRAAPLPATVVTVLAFLPMYGSLSQRPQLVSFVLLPVLIGAWFRSEQDLRPRWWLVPLCWFWSLCHGFWFLGTAYGFLAVAAVVVRRRAGPRQVLELSGVAVASFAVVLLNPVGLGVIKAPFAVNAAAKYITEWQHPHPFTPEPIGAWLMIALAVGAWCVTRRGITVYGALLLVTAAFWAWYAQRTVIVSALVSAPVLAGALDALLRSEAADRRDHPRRPVAFALRRVEGVVIAAAAGLSLLVLAFVVPHTSDKPGGVPLALDPQLDRLPAGTAVLNDYALGGWVSWRHPGLEQYIDGLATPYSPQHDDDYHAIETTGAGWYRLVLASRAPVAVVQADTTLARALERRGWRREGSDAGFVLLRRPQHPSG
jgi:hypothetical protein